MRLYVPILCLTTALFSGASAQISVYGESPAAICYQNAASGRIDIRAVHQCEEALDRGELTRRDRAATFVNLGILQMRRGENSDALASYDAAERLGVGYPGALAVNRSGALIRLGRFEAALVQTDIAIAANEANIADAWFNRAMALEAVGDQDGAVAALNEALQLRPDWGQARRQLERMTNRPG